MKSISIYKLMFCFFLRLRSRIRLERMKWKWKLNGAKSGRKQNNKLIPVKWWRMDGWTGNLINGRKRDRKGGRKTQEVGFDGSHSPFLENITGGVTIHQQKKTTTKSTAAIITINPLLDSSITSVIDHCSLSISHLSRFVCMPWQKNFSFSNDNYLYFSFVFLIEMLQCRLSTGCQVSKERKRETPMSWPVDRGENFFRWERPREKTNSYGAFLYRKARIHTMVCPFGRDSTWTENFPCSNVRRMLWYLPDSKSEKRCVMSMSK